MSQWLAEAIAHAAREYPRESCGLVVHQHGRDTYWPCRTIPGGPGDEFQAAPGDLAAAEDAGQVLAAVHSHPDQTVPRPSPADVEHCDHSGIPWHVIGCPSGRLVTIQPARDVPPLEGRQFVHGTTDCYGLCRDYYRLQHGIVLPDYPREDGWWDRGMSLYLDWFADAGFVEVSGPPEPGDALLMQVAARVPNHAAVYLGNDRILHHLHGRLSRVEPWGGDWRKRTIKVLRYAHA